MPEVEVTKAELEKAGQQILALAPYLPDGAIQAVDWYAVRLRQAEASTGNPVASRNPGKYQAALKERILADEKLLSGVMELYKDCASDRTLGEPIWSEALRPKAATGHFRVAPAA